MKFKLISTHVRPHSHAIMGLYIVLDDETTGTPYFMSRDTTSERIWISKETAVAMIREEGAMLAAKVPANIIIDLLGDSK